VQRGPDEQARVLKVGATSSLKMLVLEDICEHRTTLILRDVKQRFLKYSMFRLNDLIHMLCKNLFRQLNKLFFGLIY
jgi:hypothetical protein